MFIKIREYQVRSKRFCNSIWNKTFRRVRCSLWEKKVFSRDQKQGICARFSGCLLFMIYSGEISVIWKNRCSFFGVFELFMIVEIDVKAKLKYMNFICVGNFMELRYANGIAGFTPLRTCKIAFTFMRFWEILATYDTPSRIRKMYQALVPISSVLIMFRITISFCQQLDLDLNIN